MSTEVLDPRSAERLAKLHPILQERIPKLMTAVANRGYELMITQGLRTFGEQDGLYMQGRTRPGKKVTNAKGGQSFHNYGLAVDFALLDSNGKATWPDPHPVWLAIAEEAEKLGLSPGYRWKKQDKPHVEIPGLTWQECLAIYKRAGGGTRGLALVAAEATARFLKRG